MYYPCSENKGADQLRGYREADLRLVFAYADCWFSHEAAGINCLKNCLLFCPVLILGDSTNSYFSYCFVTSEFAALNTVVILY